MKEIQIQVKTLNNNYTIIIGSKLLTRVKKILNKNSIESEKYLLVIDSKVPKIFINKIKKALKNKKIIFHFFKSNELNKNQKSVEKIIKILSSDFLSKKKEMINLLSDIEKNKVNILVGTQLISKGFNFPNLNCIVVVDADFSGMGFDLRSTEKNIQLYNQLSGRAGRFSKDSLIIYQTFNPSDETLKSVLKNQQEKFLEEEIYLRKQKNLPPFSRLIAFIISSKSEEDSFLEAQKIKRSLLSLKKVDVMGPVTSPIFKIKNKYRTRLLLRSDSNFFVQKEINKILKKINISKKIKLTVDVDPLNFS